MLNKPKFMSPSINMYGNTVIDLNSATLPFSCIVDGNEVITDFQIVISRLKDNKVVFDTGMQTLDKPFFPINNRNQNVVFNVDLKDYSNTISGNDFKNSADAYFWAITFKNSNTGTETCSSAEVFYANDTPRVEIYFDSSQNVNSESYKRLSNNLVYNGETLKDLIGWSLNSNYSVKSNADGYLSLTAKTDYTDTHPCSYIFDTPINGDTTESRQVIYCSAQLRGHNTNSSNSYPRCYLRRYDNGYTSETKYLDLIIADGDNKNDGKWHVYSERFVTKSLDTGNSFEYFGISIGISHGNKNDTCDFKDVCVFNLTELYGRGKEPSKSWCDANLDILRASAIASRKCKLKASYSQSQNIDLKRYGWRLTDAESNYVIMDTISQNQIYGVSDDISCVCNGLTNGTSYQLELYIETQNGYFDILKKLKFNVDYTVKTLDADFEITALNDTAGIMLNWGNLRTTEGVVVGSDVSYKENFPLQSSVSIEIPEDTSVVFEGTSSGKELEIDEDSYVVLSFQFDKTQNITLFDMSGTDKYANKLRRKLEYIASSNKLKYTITKGNTVASRSKTLSGLVGELCWYVATLYPLIDGVANYKLIESIADGCDFPSGSLYPSAELYPYSGEWDKTIGEVV